MFGISGTELIVLLIVGIVVVGPKRLPDLMRRAGKMISKLRRMSTDLRSQSGIDRILREEGLEDEIRQLRELRESLSKSAMLNSLVDAANRPAPSRPRPALERKPAATALPAASAGVPALAGGSSAAAADAGAAAGSGESADSSKSATKTLGEAGSDAAAAGGAAALIRPAEGAVARGALGAEDEPIVRLPVQNPYYAFRLREYPSFGPDNYEALPDDLEEDDVPADEAAPDEAEPADPVAGEAPSTPPADETSKQADDELANASGGEA